MRIRVVGWVGNGMTDLAKGVHGLETTEEALSWHLGNMIITMGRKENGKKDKSTCPNRRSHAY
jgi:hypothetical protein